MPYIEIVLAGLAITHEQEQALTIGAIDVLDLLGSRDTESTLVFIEKTRKAQLEENAPQVVVHLKALPQTTTAAGRAQVTSAMIELLKRTLGRSLAMNYEVVIEEASSGIRMHTDEPIRHGKAISNETSSRQRKITGAPSRFAADEEPAPPFFSRRMPRF